MKRTFDIVYAIWEDMKTERSEWETEWRELSQFLLPGRGVYQTLTKPKKRKLSNPRVINTAGEDSLNVLTSGLHSRLTSPSLPWFMTEPSDGRLKAMEPLTAYYQESDDLLHKYFHGSNFYSIIAGVYTESAGFGTACIFAGDNTENLGNPFTFELLTAGEYYFTVGADGLVNQFIRIVFMSARQLKEKFPGKVSVDVMSRLNNHASGADVVNIPVMEFIEKNKFKDKAYKRYFFEMNTHVNQSNRQADLKPLKIDGFYEMPYHVVRWSTIGSDVYGVGQGSRSLNDIKRLQEMEKSFLMATHKTLDPPVQAPGKMKNKLNTLPGGKNYYANPQEVVSQIYQVNFDFQGVSAAIERVEERIGRNFYNDVFLTSSRDPDASPLRTGQVNVQEQEKLMRLGPPVERYQSELYIPLVTRCFNILKRADLLPPINPELEKLVDDIEVTLIGPLALAQRAAASSGIDRFLGFVANAAQFDEQALDNIDIDVAIQKKGMIEGVDLGILRMREAVEELRAKRAAQQKAQAEAQARAQQAAEQQEALDAQGTDAQTRNTNAQTGKILAESQQVQGQTIN